MRRSFAFVVDDVGDGGSLVVGELVEVGEVGFDLVAGVVEGPTFGVVDEQVAEAGVEGPGDADGGVEAPAAALPVSYR